MIQEYFRPKTIPEALELLARTNPVTVPLGGGTILNRPTTHKVAVVDLQNLGLDGFIQANDVITAGAAIHLQTLMEKMAGNPALVKAIHQECPINLRNMSTLAGTIISGDGRSTLLAALLALDARITLLPDETEIHIGDFLPLRKEKINKKLISQVVFPANIKLAFEMISRTPVDKPILLAAVCRWPGGRTRVVLGGFGQLPQLVSDGEDHIGLETAARVLCSHSSDEWAGSEYRQDAAGTLVHRCLEETRGM
jgi:CO/xanthine dehydrogenase FAD-binding subunit